MSKKWTTLSGQLGQPPMNKPEQPPADKPDNGPETPVDGAQISLSDQQQAALYFARKRRRLRTN